MFLKDAKWIVPLLLAFMEGKTVQWRTKCTSKWENCNPEMALSFGNGEDNYRIKPSPVEVEYTIALYKAADGEWKYYGHVCMESNKEIVKAQFLDNNPSRKESDIRFITHRTIIEG